VPFLPFVFDEPVEEAVEWTFHRVFKMVGGEEAVKGAKPTGREKELTLEARVEREKEKERGRRKKEKEL
jgi:fission process protein 1